MTILIGGEERGFSRMLHQVVVNKADAGDSPASAARSWSSSGIYGGGNRVVPTTEVAAIGVAMKVNKVLQNGDVYCGEFADGTPHGRGKYLWADGCVYEGEWRNGKAAGKGKFSWPSSATFEGEFKDGRMEGYGIFIGANGETYHGSWMADRKHGCGKKSYENGDFYEGQWRKDLQEGHGRYFWRNGNQYIGEWHKGVISGRGVLVCANGSLYDGQWEKGVPKKCGVFTWPDSCFYTGSWNRDPHSQQQASNLNATPISRTTSRRSSISSFGESPSRFLPSKNRFSVDGRPARNSTAVKNSQLIWEFRGAAGDITCDIVGNIEPSLHYRDDSELCKREIENQLQQRSHCCLSPREAKMLGETISKGHKNYELVLNLQSGIRYSVGKPSSEQPTELRPSDFDPKEKYWTRFPLEGSKLTPPPHSTNFRWKDYCPNVFRHLRKVFSMDPLDYTKAICGDESLRELSSPGKSGSLFYLTQDGRFIIKIVKKCEVKVLIKMLLSYYQHVCKYEDSLVSRFFGAHCVKPSGGHKVRFIVMGNLFFPESRIHRRFDLKGSSHGRTIRKTEEKVDENTTLKDLDLDLIFYIQKTWFKKLIWQLERDCEFLEAESIMDYSLLVGIHFCDDDFSASKMGMVAASQKLADLHKSFHGNGPLIELSFPELGWQDTARFMDGRKPPVRRLGTNMPARAQYVGVGGGPMVQPPSSQPHKVVLYFGIIDILQDYDIGKKLEHVYKSLHVDSTSISAVDPKLYSARFHDFVGKIFIEDD